MTDVLDLPSTRQEAWRWADTRGIAAAAALAPVAPAKADFLDPVSYTHLTLPTKA